MPTTTYKILGQVAPAIGTANNVYTVPASTQAVVSTINVCNPDATQRSTRIAVIKSGESLAAKHYIAYDVPIALNDSLSITIGITMGANDSISVYTNGSSNVAYSVFGSETV
jgi:hypothetical protein